MANYARLVRQTFADKARLDESESNEKVSDQISFKSAAEQIQPQAKRPFLTPSVFQPKQTPSPRTSFSAGYSFAPLEEDSSATLQVEEAKSKPPSTFRSSLFAQDFKMGGVQDPNEPVSKFGSGNVADQVKKVSKPPSGTFSTSYSMVPQKSGNQVSFPSVAGQPPQTLPPSKFMTPADQLKPQNQPSQAAVPYNTTQRRSSVQHQERIYSFPKQNEPKKSAVKEPSAQKPQVADQTSQVHALKPDLVKREEFLKRMKEFGQDRNRQTISVWQFDTNDETDIVFIRDFATPYFSSVYQSLVNQGNGGILEVARVKSYFNLPEIIFSRLIGIMNENGDDRIDHEEWLLFFLRLTCSSPRQRIYLVFQIFDIQNSQILRPDFVKTILKHLPLFAEGARFGVSFEDSQESQLTRVDLIKEKLKDHKEIGVFVDKFFEDNQAGLVFRAFEQLLINFSSDLYFLVFSCFSECIPCYRNFLRARSNNYAIFRKKSAHSGQFLKLAYPALAKAKDRYEAEQLNVSIKEKTFQPISLIKKPAVRKQSQANVVEFNQLGKLDISSKPSLQKNIGLFEVDNDTAAEKKRSKPKSCDRIHDVGSRQKQVSEGLPQDKLQTNTKKPQNVYTATNVIEEESENTDQSDFDPLSMLETGKKIIQHLPRARINSMPSQVNFMSNKLRQDQNKVQKNEDSQENSQSELQFEQSEQQEQIKEQTEDDQVMNEDEDYNERMGAMFGGSAQEQPKFSRGGGTFQVAEGSQKAKQIKFTTQVPKSISDTELDKLLAFPLAQDKPETRQKYQRKATIMVSQHSTSNSNNGAQIQSKKTQTKQIKLLDEIQKNLGFKIESDQRPMITNDFMRGLSPSIHRISGPSLFLTQMGYFKNGWSILTGDELYFYQNKDEIQHSQMIVVQGAQIISSPSDPPVEFLTNQPQYRSVYRIQINLGGRDGVVQMWFTKQESCQKWHRALVSASGCYKLQNFYDEISDQVLGRGSKAVVYRGFNKYLKQEVAIKRIDKSKVESGYDFFRSIQLMRLGVHHYVGRLLDYFNSNEYYYQVFELELGGTLSQYMKDFQNILSEARCRVMTQKLAQGIEFLHEYGILIGKLTLDTILMTDKSDQAIPRISNLSTARILMPYQKVKDHTLEPSINWAPEVCLSQSFDLKIDSWSFGTILYHLLTGQPHITISDDLKAVQKQIVGFKLDIEPLKYRKVSAQAIDLVQKCLCLDPARRISINAALKHAWFKQS